MSEEAAIVKECPSCRTKHKLAWKDNAKPSRGSIRCKKCGRTVMEWARTRSYELVEIMRD